MTLYPTNQLYTKWGASVDPEEHPEMETLGFINRSVELPYSRAKRYIKQCVEKYGELPETPLLGYGQKKGAPLSPNLC